MESDGFFIGMQGTGTPNPLTTIRPDGLAKHFLPVRFIGSNPGKYSYNTHIFIMILVIKS